MSPRKRKLLGGRLFFSFFFHQIIKNLFTKDTQEFSSFLNFPNYTLLRDAPWTVYRILQLVGMLLLVET